MGSKVTLILSIWMMLISSFVFLEASPCVLTSEKNSYRLTSCTSFLKEQDRRWYIEDIVSPGFSHRFHQQKKPVLTLGYLKYPIWVRIDLEKKDKITSEFVLRIKHPIHSIEYYLKRGKAITRKRSDFTSPFIQKEIKHRNHVFPVNLDTNQNSSIYLRIENKGAYRIPMELWKTKSLLEADRLDQLIGGAFLGILLLMTLYNFVLFILYKEKSYLFSVLFISAFLAWFATFHGYVSEFFCKTGFYWYATELIILGGITELFLVLFVRAYLSTRQNVPKIDRFLQILCWILLFHLCTFWQMGERLANQVLHWTSLFMLPACIFAGFVVWLKGHRPARYFILAWGALLSGSFFSFLRNLAIIEEIYMSSHGVQFGFIISAILCSFGLSNKFNIMPESGTSIRLFPWKKNFSKVKYGFHGKAELAPRETHVREGCSLTSKPYKSNEDHQLLSQKNPHLKNTQGLKDSCLLKTQSNAPKHSSIKQGEKRILLINNNPVDVQVQDIYLSSRGFIIEKTPSDEKAFDNIKVKGNPDLILFDISSIKSALEFSRLLKNNHVPDSIPVIFILGENQQADLVEVIKASGNDYISKPYNEIELLIRVENCLYLHKTIEKFASLREFRQQIGKIKTPHHMLLTAVRLLHKIIFTCHINLFHENRSIKSYPDTQLNPLIEQPPSNDLEPLIFRNNTDEIVFIDVPAYADSLQKLLSRKQPTDEKEQLLVFIKIKEFEDYRISIMINPSHALERKIATEYIEYIVKELKSIRNTVPDITTNSKTLDDISFIRQNLNSILCIKSFPPYCSVICDGQESEPLLIRTSLQKLEVFFTKSELLRIHRSYLINPKKIEVFRKKSARDYEIHLKNESNKITIIPVGRSYQAVLKRNIFSSISP